MAPTRKQRKGMLASMQNVSKPAKLMERKSIPSGYISPGNSPFLKKLPREIRDRIYDELLIVQRTPEDQDKYDKIQTCLSEGKDEFTLERELDFLAQEYVLTPDLSRANKGMLYIGKNKGILTANKQIYDEATTTLFGKNLFGLGPQSERIQAFWRCHIHCRCIPHERPCLARPETLAKVKHIYLIVSVTQPDGVLTDPRAMVKNIRINLQTIVDTLQDSVNHLLTLTIRYWSHFGGEFEAVRHSLEGPLPRGMSKRPPAMIHNSITGKFHQIRAHDMHSTIFADIHILDALKTLKGVADYVNIRGDLPCGYRDDLKKVLSAANPGVGAKKMRKAEAEIASKRPKPSGGLAAFAAQKLAEDPYMDPDTRKLYEDLTKVSTKSPAVKSIIFPEFAHGGSMGHGSAHQSSARPVTRVVPAGSIGLLDGKPVFGPVRPPAMDGAE